MSHTILIGDAREQLATIPAGTVQTCVTSPPYYGLRDYNVDGQIGLEDTVDAYVAALVDVFREVKRVLRPDGTVWLNLGSSYVSSAMFSEDSIIREDITDEERAYVCSELANMLGMWASGGSPRDFAEVSRRHEKGVGEGHVPPLLQPAQESALSEQPGDATEDARPTESVASEAQGSTKRRNSGEPPASQGESVDSTGRQVCVLRRTDAGIPDTRSHQRGRTEAPGGSRAHAQTLSSSREGRLPERQVPGAVLELQRIDRAVGFLSTLTVKRDLIPEHLQRFFKPKRTYKPKDDAMVPHRVFDALMADGWYGRSDICWAKSNPMPESVTDRPTRSHEYIFLLSKRSTYYYDAAAIAEPATQHEQGIRGNHDGQKMPPETSNGRNGSTLKDADRTNRNKRSVWTVSTKPYSGAHFAVFPPKLIEPCILAGSSEKGGCSACGAPWVRVVERENGYNGAGRATDTYTGQAYEHPQSAPRGPKSNFGPGNIGTTKGWAPSCACDAGDPVPQTVLDPFAGSGTTGEVAERHGRHAVLIELNPEYRPLIERRLAQRPLWDAMSVAD